MSLIFTGAILFVVGKIAKAGIVEKIGLYAIYAGIAIWILGIFGIGLPFSLPF